MNKIFTKLKTWIKLWPDVWATPITIALIIASYFAIDYINSLQILPPIGTFDIGTLVNLIFVVAVIAILNAATFLGIELNDQPLWQYYKRKYEAGKKPNVLSSDDYDFENITSWQRLKLFYFWRAFLLSLGAALLWILT
jgi:hypothetical protein